MKNKIFERPTEKVILFNKKDINKLQFEEQFELVIKKTNNHNNLNKKYNEFQKKEKLYYCIICFVNLIYFCFFRKSKEKKKLYNRNKIKIKMNVNNKRFFEFIKLIKKDLYYKGKKLHIKNYFKRNNKKNRITNIKKKTCVILLIFFNIIATNNNKIEFKFSNITLKIIGP